MEGARKGGGEKKKRKKMMMIIIKEVERWCEVGQRKNAAGGGDGHGTYNTIQCKTRQASWKKQEAGTIRWHTCPLDGDGRGRSPNPSVAGTGASVSNMNRIGSTKDVSLEALVVA